MHRVCNRYVKSRCQIRHPAALARPVPLFRIRTSSQGLREISIFLLAVSDAERRMLCTPSVSLGLDMTPPSPRGKVLERLVDADVVASLMKFTFAQSGCTRADYTCCILIGLLALNSGIN
jgi:hypothetical protein